MFTLKKIYDFLKLLFSWWTIARHLIWSLLGIVELDPLESIDKPSVTVGYALYGAFLIMGVILLINMMIALLSNTYTRVQVRYFALFSSLLFSINLLSVSQSDKCAILVVLFGAFLFVWMVAYFLILLDSCFSVRLRKECLKRISNINNRNNSDLSKANQYTCPWYFF